MAKKDQAEYEELVRQQLTELGYNSEAIPDAVGWHIESAPCIVVP